MSNSNSINKNSKFVRSKDVKISHKESKKKDLLLSISKLSYEDSLKELDLIISKLHNQSLLVEELEENYLLATLYLEHCELLLDNVEQKVIEFDSSKIESYSD
ncbi:MULTISPECIES: exodeoxyribonuclease VII small subunit [unclassified Prochlorococcus]|uniref:exodeoxyribonuclease VII small subunit n=1 Tax=unclassified Prochlorococcus TaxID=2627481 RepID=UPI00053393C2|nr:MULTISPECIES: exodeoxyribonuclease VII small subunit [unclassified Prochlorococcus]KGG16845.1 putative exodeoxyribonuclease small subunit [Prochlorococcus sp. MIT 0602]KGG18181.1 putative exodeoxyribonuclease small subunit [Prochlorococcus sp. MIT 0603]